MSKVEGGGRVMQVKGGRKNMPRDQPRDQLRTPVLPLLPATLVYTYICGACRGWL